MATSSSSQLPRALFEVREEQGDLAPDHARLLRFPDDRGGVAEELLDVALVAVGGLVGRRRSVRRRSASTKASTAPADV